jgi:flagellar L-ring protein precursor FlgH
VILAMKPASSFVTALAALLLALGLSGCATAPALLKHSPEFAPVLPVEIDKPRLATGAIYIGRQNDNFFGRSRSYKVGDLITVLLNESAQAARQQSRSVSRESSNDVIPSGLSAVLGGQSARLAGLNLNGAAISSDGQGTADQRASLTGSVAATVVPGRGRPGAGGPTKSRSVTASPPARVPSPVPSAGAPGWALAAVASGMRLFGQSPPPK